MEGIEYTENFLIIKQKPLILKLRSLGAGVEETDETKITYLEAAYFAERGVLPLKKDDLLSHISKNDPLYLEKYFVIKYLRDRGYIIRPSLDSTQYLRLHRKGYRPGEDKTYYLIIVLQKNLKLGLNELLPYLETAGRLRKELAIAFVDLKEDQPTFIKFGKMNFE
jgi:tRNA splicing endonuclease